MENLTPPSIISCVIMIIIIIIVIIIIIIIIIVVIIIIGGKSELSQLRQHCSPQCKRMLSCNKLRRS